MPFGTSIEIVDAPGDVEVCEAEQKTNIFMPGRPVK